MRFRGEIDDLERACWIADKWGYGNLIEYLLARWGEKDARERKAHGHPAYPHFALHRKVAMGEAAAEQLHALVSPQASAAGTGKCSCSAPPKDGEAVKRKAVKMKERALAPRFREGDILVWGSFDFGCNCTLMGHTDGSATRLSTCRGEPETEPHVYGPREIAALGARVLVPAPKKRRSR